MADKQSPPVELAITPDELAAQAKDVHLYRVGGMLIGAIAGTLGFVEAPDRATASWAGEAFLTELIRSIKPRDAVEEMLVIQMAFTHQRIVNLSLKAADQVLTKHVAVVNQALDGACNIFLRQMLALAEYRRAAKVVAPGKPAKDSQDEFRANEQGYREEASAAALPPVGGGINVPAGGRGASSALGTEHGPANGNGQVALKAKRAEARAMQPGPAC